MKIYFKGVFLGLATVLLASCTSQSGLRPIGDAPSRPELPPLSRVDIPEKSLPSERIKGYGHGYGYGRQIIKTASDPTRRHKPIP